MELGDLRKIDQNSQCQNKASEIRTPTQRDESWNPETEGKEIQIPK